MPIFNIVNKLTLYKEQSIFLNIYEIITMIALGFIFICVFISYLFYKKNMARISSLDRLIGGHFWWYNR